MLIRNPCTVLILLCGSCQTYAQEKGTIDLGGFSLTPSMNTQLLHIDNIAYSSSNEEEVSSWGSIIAPRLSAFTEFNGNRVVMDYRLVHGEFFSSEADNYTDHFVNLTSNFTIDNRNRLKGFVSYEDSHDERGRRYSNGFGNELESVDTYKNSDALLTYSYGALSASGRVDFSVGYGTVDYDNDSFRSLPRDRESLDYQAVFSYRLWNYTNVVVDGRRREINYDEDSDNPLDSSENAIFAGLNWDYNDVTQSFAKIGYREKNFTSDLRDDFSGLSWEVGINYAPFSYSEISLSTKQSTRETNTNADYIDTTNTQVSWKHEWLQRLATTVSMVLVTDDYVGTAENLREDDSARILFAADYEFRRWLNLRVYYSMNERDSNRSQFNYDRNIFGLTARITL